MKKRSGEIHELTVCPWTTQNPRHDHQQIFILNVETLLLVWSEYYADRPSVVMRTPYSRESSTSDQFPCRISGKISRDRGRNWSDTFTLQENIGDRNVKHPNLLRIPTGDILFFFTRWDEDNRTIFMRRSEDECETWTDPGRISSRPGHYCINADHVLQLVSGRIILPCHEAVPGKFTAKTGNTWPAKLRAFCLYSDDNGYTWHESETKIESDGRGADEPAVVERNDGVLTAVFRTTLGELYQTYSHDRGENWTESRPTGLSSPAAPPLMKRIPETGDLLLVWNNSKPYDNETHQPRNPLCSAISKDEGESWENIKAIEDHRGYNNSYPGVTFLDDEVLVTFYKRSEAMARDSWVKLKIFKLDWFYRRENA